jgi:hypothetical protein
VGDAAGSTQVTIAGTGLSAVKAVVLRAGSSDASPATLTIDASNSNDTQIQGTTAAHAEGAVDVAFQDGSGNDLGTPATGAFTYQAAAPSFTSITPAVCDCAGGTTVTIVGTGLSAVKSVVFRAGSGDASSATLTIDPANSNDTQIQGTTTAHAEGAVDVAFQDGSANDLGAAAAGVFTYQAATPVFTSITPATGVPAGSTAVTIVGTGLSAVKAVAFRAGNADASPAALTIDAANSNDTQIQGTTAAHAAGAVDVAFQDGSGNDLGTPAASAFTYQVAPPVFTSITPNRGALAGGTQVTIKGTGLSGADQVLFRTNNADTNAASLTMDKAQCNDTQIVGTTGAHDAGAVDVAFIDAAGNDTGTPGAAAFTYIDPPHFTAIDPNRGDIAGGTTVRISGIRLSGIGQVVLRAGDADASPAVITVNAAQSNDGQIMGTTAAHAIGVVDLAFQDPSGTDLDTEAGVFTYEGSPGTPVQNLQWQGADGSEISSANVGDSVTISFDCAHNDDNQVTVAVLASDQKTSLASPPATERNDRTGYTAQWLVPSTGAAFFFQVRLMNVNIWNAVPDPPPALSGQLSVGLPPPDHTYYYVTEKPALAYVVTSNPPPADSGTAFCHKGSETGDVGQQADLVTQGTGTLNLDLSPFTPNTDSPIFLEFVYKKAGHDDQRAVRALSLADPAPAKLTVPKTAKPGDQIQFQVAGWNAVIYDTQGTGKPAAETDATRIPQATIDTLKWRANGSDLGDQGQQITYTVPDDCPSPLAVEAYLPQSSDWKATGAVQIPQAKGTSTLTVVVKTPGGKAIPDADVVIVGLRGGSGDPLKTDAKGQVVIKALPVQDWDIQATKAKFGPVPANKGDPFVEGMAEDKFTPKSAAPVTRSLVLAPTTAHLVVKVQTQDGKPVEKASVEVVGLAGGDADPKLTDAKGVFDFGDLARQSWDIRVTKDGCGPVPSKGQAYVPGVAEQTIDTPAEGDNKVTIKIVRPEVKKITAKLRGVKGVRDPKKVLPDNVLRPSTSKETDLILNTPVTLIRGGGDHVDLAVTMSAKVSPTWDLSANDNPTTPTLPTLTPSADGQSATLSTDQGGAFSVTVSFGDSKVVWNVVFVWVDVDTDTSVIRLSGADATHYIDGTPKTGPHRNDNLFAASVASGDFTSNYAMFYNVWVRLHGGGKAGDVGLDNVRIQYIQEGVADTLTGNYNNGGIINEVPDGGIPVVDTNGGKPIGWKGPFSLPGTANSPFVWVPGSVLVVPDQLAAARRLVGLDSPAGSFDNTHTFKGSAKSDKINAITGRNDFMVGVASISTDAPNMIVVHATFSWQADFAGTVAIAGGRSTYTATTAQTTGDTTFALVSPDTGGQPVDDAGFELMHGRFNSNLHFKPTP